MRLKSTALLSLVLLMLAVLGCVNENKRPQEGLPDSGAYKIVDSIVLDEPLMFLKDKMGSEMIFVRYTNQDLLLYNESTKTANLINKFGQDPHSIKTPIYENIGFISQKVFWISDVGNIKKYDLMGNFVEQLNVKSVNEYTPLTNILFKDGYILAFENPVGFANDYNHYTKKYKLFVKHQIEDGTQNRFFDYPPEGSALFTEDYFLANNHYYHTNLIEENVLAFMYAVEPIVYKIDLENFSITEKNRFSPEYFEPLKVYFKDALDDKATFMHAYMGSVFTSHFIVDKKNYAFYSIPYSLDYMTEFVKTHKNFPFEEAPDIKFALTIFDNDGKKLSDDIVFPTRLGKPLLMDEKGIIYFMKNPTEADEKKGQTVYYKVRLTDAKP